MLGVRPLVFSAVMITLLFSCFPQRSSAQIVAGGGQGGFYSSSKLEQIDNSSLEVQVRSPNGSTLSSLALVSVSNLSGQTITSKTTFGSQVIFTPLNKGQYVVNVEAPGYAKAQVDAQVTSSHGQQLVIVTLRPESGDGGAPAASTGIVLAPKAQKEANKGMEALHINKLDEAVKHL